MATKGTRTCDRCGKVFEIDQAPGKVGAPPEVIRARAPVPTEDGRGVVTEERDICTSCVLDLVALVKKFWQKVAGTKKSKS